MRYHRSVNGLATLQNHSTHDDAVVMPFLVSGDLFSFAEASATQVEIFANVDPALLLGIDGALLI
jgi:hypothetical protein